MACASMVLVVALAITDSLALEDSRDSSQQTFAEVKSKQLVELRDQRVAELKDEPAIEDELMEYYGPGGEMIGEEPAIDDLEMDEHVGELIKEQAVELRDEHVDDCAMSVMDKCYGVLPPDGSQPDNLIEEIGAVEDAQTCQKFCKDLYPGTCTWFMFDRTTNDCKLFKGSLTDLHNDCREVGYAVHPKYTECDKVFDASSAQACFNFREDYCRFEFSLLDNLEKIRSLTECQTACEYITNCTYFVYDAPSQVCKVNTATSDNRVCDIIHGTASPNLQECLDDNKLGWAKKPATEATRSLP